MNLNIIPNGAIKRVHVSQNDVGRTLTFELFNNSTSYTIPSGATVKIQGTKPSGFGFSETCTVSDNTVTVDTTEEMTDEYGYIETELQIKYNDNTIGTSNFVLAVEKNPHPDTITDGSMETIIPELTLLVNEVKGYAEEIEGTYHSYGSPWVASTVAQMTDTDKVYVYTGSETGYTSGNWYYYNGSAWVSGGVYNAVAVNTDTTLTQSGVPADAKAVGDLKSDIISFEEGKIILRSEIVQNSYPNSSGGFSTYNGWDRTDYIQIEGGQSVYFMNPDLQTTDNAWYAEDKSIISLFTVPIGSPSVLVAPSNAKYMVASNQRAKFFESIYVKQEYYASKFDWELSSLASDYDLSPLKDGFSKAVMFDDWEVGYIYSNGKNLARTYAIRNEVPHKLTNPMTVIKHDSSLRWFYTEYDSSGAFVSQSNYIQSNTYAFTPDPTKLYRLCITLVDTSNDIDMKSGILGYRFYENANKYVENPYFLLDRVTFNGRNAPQFITHSSVALKIVFKANTVMDAVSGNGYKSEKGYTFTEDTSFICDASNVLVWDVEANTVKLLSSNDALTKYLVLASASYGKFNFGALLPYYEAQQKALITYNYPPYYDDSNYLGSKISTIRGNGQSAGCHGDSFVFVTDTHWSSNRKKSPALIRSIINQTMINKVFHDGDIPVAYQTEDEMYENVRGDNEAFRYAVGDYLYRIVGNHDVHATDNTDADNPVYYVLTNDEVYGLMMKEQENRVHYNPNEPNGMYYYFDNATQKIRYICLNNFQSPANPYMSNYQVSWVADRVLELTSGWSVVFLGHCSIIQAQNTDYAHYNDIRGVISAIANKTTFTASYGRTFDFTNSDVDVVGYFCGHGHVDMLNTYDGVTYCLTTCDALYQDDGYGRAMNTISEQAFDVVQIDTNSKHVYLTRIGAGSDRTFTY